MNADLLALVLGGKERLERAQSSLLKAMREDFRQIREAKPEAMTFTAGHAKLLRATFPSLLADLMASHYVLEKAYSSALSKLVLQAAQIDDLQTRLAKIEEH